MSMYTLVYSVGVTHLHQHRHLHWHLHLQPSTIWITDIKPWKTLIPPHHHWIIQTHCSTSKKESLPPLPTKLNEVERWVCTVNRTTASPFCSAVSIKRDAFQTPVTEMTLCALRGSEQAFCFETVNLNFCFAFKSNRLNAKHLIALWF